MMSLTAADGKLIILELNGTLHTTEATSALYRELSSGDVSGGRDTEYNRHTSGIVRRENLLP